MNPALILAAAWLLVIGYGLFYVGYQNQSNKPVSFKDAFFPGNFFRSGSTPAQAPNAITAQGSSMVAA